MWIAIIIVAIIAYYFYSSNKLNEKKVDDLLKSKDINTIPNSNPTYSEYEEANDLMKQYRADIQTADGLSERLSMYLYYENMFKSFSNPPKEMREELIKIKAILDSPSPR